MTAFLVLKTVTARSSDGESYTHAPGTVLSEWEVSEFIRDKIVKDGDVHYRAHFEPLTDEEAQHHRVKSTAAADPRFSGGQQLTAPWDDYVGLHPTEILNRLKKCSSLEEVARIKEFERAGMNRSVITGFTAPVEREPFVGYAEMGVREVLNKMAILSDPDVRDVINYELGHRRRPAIIQYEKESYDSPSDAEAVEEPAVA